jgi:RecA-family ATPase
VNVTVRPDTRTSIEPRQDLLLSSWLSRDLPLRDYLLGNIFCTTSRWLIFGETGVGKTLLGADLAGAISAGEGLLGWTGCRRSRVMYLDGELPAETFQERMRLVADRYGPDLALIATIAIR